MIARSAFGVALAALAGPACAETGKTLQGMGESPLTAVTLLQTVGGLALVLVLILGLAWLVRRTGHVPGAGKGLVRVLGGASLGPRERAVVVAVDGVRLLLGVAPGRVQMLHVLAADAAVEEATFRRRLDQATQAGKGD